MSDFVLKIGVEGEKQFKDALRDIQSLRFLNGTGHIQKTLYPPNKNKVEFIAILRYTKTTKKEGTLKMRIVNNDNELNEKLSAGNINQQLPPPEWRWV